MDFKENIHRFLDSKLEAKEGTGPILFPICRSSLIGLLDLLLLFWFKSDQTD